MKKSKFKQHYGIGIDIGGTKISIVLGTSQGRILEKRVIKTLHGKECKKSFTQMREAALALMSKRRLHLRDIKGIGVGVPGLVNYKSFVIEESPNMRDWVGINLHRSLKRVFNKPIYIDNDANATVVAEKLYGVGKGCQNLIYMTISTGIGAGIILNGQLIHGTSSSAGEVGHSIVNPQGWKNHLNIRGTLEGESSGRAIARKASNLIRKSHRLAKLKKAGQLTAKTVKEAALKGDYAAIHALRDAGKNLGFGISNLIMILNPEMIILGGGVLKGKGGNILFKATKESVKANTWRRPRNACKVVKTGALDKIADLGALSLVFNR